MFKIISILYWFNFLTTKKIQIDFLLLCQCQQMHIVTLQYMYTADTTLYCL